MANVNEGERWTIGVCAQGMCEPTIGAGICGCRHEVVKPGLYRYESRVLVEVVSAKALREAREELERLRSGLHRQVEKPAPSATAESSSPEPEPQPDGSERCGRLLVGQCTDTWDPVCIREAGHSGRCQHDLMAALEASLAAIRSPSGSSLASEPKLDGSGR